jgi:spore germination cell wall hydrolase CwlJ-like protein
VVTVVKEGSTWTKIESGSIKGYVKTSYLLFGQDAYANAKKVCKTYAYVKTDGLRVRLKASEKAKVLTTADKGDKLLYNKKADTEEGWVAVTVDKTTGYVAEEYVKLKLGTSDAVSIEEIVKLQAASATSSVSSVSSVSTGNSVSASSNDVTLLAALIQCEAGGESYTGKVAVGAVVLNRMRSSRFPSSISGVIYQSGQFSPVRNGALARRLSGSISSSCRQAAIDALAGSDPTGGALFFHRVNGSSGLVIGNHVFY